MISMHNDTPHQDSPRAADKVRPYLPHHSLQPGLRPDSGTASPCRDDWRKRRLRTVTT